MVVSIDTSVRTLVHGIKMRPMLGLQDDISILAFNAMNRYIEYCNSRPEVIYRSHAETLRRKSEELKFKCKNIIYKKVSFSEPVDMLRDKTIEDVPTDEVLIRYDDIIDVHSYKGLITEVYLESEDLTFNGRNNISLRPFKGIVARCKYIYKQVDEDSFAKIPKVFHQHVTSLGYELSEVRDSKVIYISPQGTEMPLEATISKRMDISSTLRVKVLYIGYNESIHESKMATITLRHNVGSEYRDVVRSEVVEKVDVPEVTDGGGHIEMMLPLDGLTLDIKNFYEVTHISGFLKYSHKEHRVRLSDDYRYENLNGRLIAVPKDAYRMLDDGYEVLNAEESYLELYKDLPDGNREVIMFYTFPINDSLFMKYRTKEGDRLPSDEYSIVFRIDAKEEDRFVTNHVEYV